MKQTRPINILSLFGGIECGRQACENKGLKINKYYSSEFDKYPRSQTEKNFPDIIHLGDVRTVNPQELEKIDLLYGGSPCQDLSIAKAGGKGLAGDKSSLFFEFVRILNEAKPKYFFLENVASMKKADREEITRILGVEPIMIDSALVSAQRRRRLYWVGQLNGKKYETVHITQPEDRGIFLKDILEDIPMEDPRWKPLDEKYLMSMSKRISGFIYRKDKVFAYQSDKKRSTVSEHVYCTPEGKGESMMTAHIPKVIIGQFRRTSLRIHSEQEKTCTITANLGTGGNNVPIILTEEKSKTIISHYGSGAFPQNMNTTRERSIVFGLAHRNRGEGKKPECNFEEKSNSLTTVQSDSEIVKTGSWMWRKLTVTECERLQGLPDGYTKDLSPSRAYKAIGNGWTVPVIEHILSFFDFENETE